MRVGVWSGAEWPALEWAWLVAEEQEPVIGKQAGKHVNTCEPTEKQ